MGAGKWFGIASCAAVVAIAVGAAPALADPLTSDPLTPLTPNEVQYLDQLRKVFAAKHDPAAFRSDGELLGDGHFVCAKRDVNQVGQAVTFMTPAITQLAFIYLCP